MLEPWRALITLAGTVWYPDYLGTTRAWGLSPLEDQQLGGLVMWVPACSVYIVAGLALVLVFQPYFPRRLVLDPVSVAVVFVITIVICLIASTLGIRLALKVDPAEALASSG